MNLNTSLDELMKITGALTVAVVDSSSGMLLGSKGHGIDIEIAAAGNTEVVRAKLQTMQNLGFTDQIEDILITLGKQYHIIRPVVSKPGLFIYIVLDRQSGNLALARRQVLDIESQFEF